MDTQVLVQILHAEGEITEIPISTYYGETICQVNGLAYALDVLGDVLECWLARRGFGSSEWIPTPERVDPDAA